MAKRFELRTETANIGLTQIANRHRYGRPITISPTEQRVLLFQTSTTNHKLIAFMEDDPKFQRVLGLCHPRIIRDHENWFKGKKPVVLTPEIEGATVKVIATKVALDDQRRYGWTDTCNIALSDHTIAQHHLDELFVRAQTIASNQADMIQELRYQFTEAIQNAVRLREKRVCCCYDCMKTRMCRECLGTRSQSDQYPN